MVIDYIEKCTQYQYFLIDEASRVSVETPFYGKEHSLLVKAQYNDDYSLSTKWKVVVASGKDPHVQDGVNVVGVFIPTPRVTITLEVTGDIEHQLSFIGPVAPQALNLVVGDIVTGFTNNFTSFARRIVGVSQQSTNGVVLRVKNVPLDVIFDALSIDGTYEISRTISTDATKRRRLFLHNWISDNIIKPIKENVIDPIGDAIVNTAEGIVDFLEDGKFEVEDKFSIMDINEKFKELLIGDN